MVFGTVLCVDDEPNVLKTLNRMLMPFVNEVLLAKSGPEAISILKDTSVDLIICDMRMQPMSGYETLQAARNLQPKAHRIILSGYAEKNTILKTVLDGTANIYIQKPWDTEKFQQLITHMLTIQKELNRDGLQELFENLHDLPALPKLYQKIIKMIKEDNTAEEIAQEIEHEPAFAARILHIANSAIYGVSIGSLCQAVVYLGLNTVKNIILTCEVFKNLPEQHEGHYSIKSLWIHSNLCSLAVSSLYRMKENKVLGDDLASAGLLHDIGKFMLIKYFPKQCLKIEDIIDQNSEKNVCEVEQEIIGASHSELGGLLMDWWSLPINIVESCLFHHAPLNKNSSQSNWIALLNVADYIAWTAQEKPAVLPSKKILKVAGFNTDILNNIEIHTRLEKCKDNLLELI
ncbi:MAG: HDOD domain-containing protein [Planctomycetota bacterium]|jgi:HD-like signal output (HDOD) protein